MDSKSVNSISYVQTLILNHAYCPYEVVDWKDAVYRMFKGKVEVIVQYDEILTVLGHNHLLTFPELRQALRQVVGMDTESITIKVPAVAVLRRRMPTLNTKIRFSKFNVCLRDNFTCQYCGERLPMTCLNYDHVVPRDHGGKTTWGNIVMSCYPCNLKKANRTPSEAGMKLLSVPKQPKVLPMSFMKIGLSHVPEEWAPFLESR
jgi:5-methylcytosine-specific restriction endonuclease McrA